MDIREEKIEEVLARDGVYVCTTSGVSMMPMLRDRRDTVVITPVSGRLKKYDVALYRFGGKYLLHRVVKVLPDSYICCGDNCITPEVGVTDADVIGILTEVWRGDKKLNLDGGCYKIYYKLRVATFGLRRFVRRAGGKILSLFRKKRT